MFTFLRDCYIIDNERKIPMRIMGQDIEDHILHIFFERLMESNLYTGENIGLAWFIKDVAYGDKKLGFNEKLEDVIRNLEVENEELKMNFNEMEDRWMEAEMGFDKIGGYK